MLVMCAHEFDTQVNEGMNTCIARYAPKTRTYSKSISVEIRVLIGVCIFLTGYHYFWTELLQQLEIDICPALELYLLKRDKEKVSKAARDHNHANMAKRGENGASKLT